MENRLTKYVNTLWVVAALFAIARYLCAAILTAGKMPDAATFHTVLDSLGPFLPLMSLACLAGALALLAADLITSKRKK